MCVFILFLFSIVSGITIAVFLAVIYPAIIIIAVGIVIIIISLSETGSSTLLLHKLKLYIRK